MPQASVVPLLPAVQTSCVLIRCRKDIIGIILVKELVQELLIGPRKEKPRPIAELRMRSLPMLYADMALYDMLHLFETGRSHMALLARPRSGHGLTAAEAAEAFSEAPLPVNGKLEHQHEAQENGHSEHLNGMAEVLHAEVLLGTKVMHACCPSSLL